ncbi:unnamed protein product [Boreogadus saida]
MLQFRPAMVNLVLDDGRSLGLMIRGGAEYALGIYITGVDQGSAAECGGLKGSGLLAGAECQAKDMFEWQHSAGKYEPPFAVHYYLLSLQVL